MPDTKTVLHCCEDYRSSDISDLYIWQSKINCYANAKPSTIIFILLIVVLSHLSRV